MAARHTSASRRATARRYSNPTTFICTACGAVEQRPTPALPAGWFVRQVDGDLHAFCGDEAMPDLGGRMVQ